MKTTLDIAHTGTLGDDDRHRMSFDENSVTQLMGMLIDLYSDKPGAVIREIISNARDAHAAAGNPAPVEVDRPDSMNPTFVVRDFGVGMSTDQIINQFSKYGFSSKRDTNDQVGMMGLGCKSPLTYTSQFTLTSRKDGREAVVLITRDSDGCGVVQIISEVDTDKPNGVEVSIPVKEVWSFNNKIDNFVRFMDPGTILVDGEPVATVWEDPLYRPLDDDVLISAKGENVVVMGGVAYPIDAAYQPFWRDPNRYYSDVASAGIVARVPIGTVKPTPSREALHYTKLTKETLTTLKDYVHAATLRKAKADVASAPTATEALVRATGWKGTLAIIDGKRSRGSRQPPSPFEWGGNEIPLGETYTLPPDEDMQVWVSFGGEQGFTEGTLRYIPLDPTRLHGTTPVLVTNFTHTLLSKQMKMRMKKWLKTNTTPDRYGRHPDHRFYLYSGSSVPLPWWDSVRRVDFSEIAAIEIPKGPARAKKPENTVNVLSVYGNIKCRELTPEEAKGRIIISTTDQPYDLKDRYEDVFSLIKATYVRVAKPSLAKFKEQFPHAEDIMDAITKEVQAFEASITEAEWFTYKHSDEITNGGVLQLDPAKVLDPDLKAIITAFSSARPNIWYLVNQWSRVQKATYLPSLEAIAKRRVVSDLGLSKVEDRYPLVRHISTHLYSARHSLYASKADLQKMVLEYVNSIYVVREQKRIARDAAMAKAGLAGRRRTTRKRMSQKRGNAAFSMEQQRIRNRRSNTQKVAYMNKKRAIEQEKRIRWKCSGCHGFFRGDHQEICPRCGRIGYWTGSFKPEETAGIQGEGFLPHQIADINRILRNLRNPNPPVMVSPGPRPMTNLTTI